MTTIQQNLQNLNNQILTIGEFSIRQDEDGRYSLTDLHRASGRASKHQPSNFLRIEQTQELIREIEQFPDMRTVSIDHSSDMRSAVKTINGGNNRGTYAVKEIVYAYAMWISAKFHLMVIRAYDALVMGFMSSNQVQLKIEDKTTKQDRVPLKDAVNMLVGKAKFLSYSDAYKLVHHRFGVEHIEDIPVEQIPAAVEYIHHLIGEYIPKAEIIEDSDLKALRLLDMDVVSKVHDYVWALHREIDTLGGKKPDFPAFDKETIAQAIVTRIVESSRMLLNFDRKTGVPVVSLIPSNCWVLDSKGIVGAIGDSGGIGREFLPDIIKAAATRLSK